LYLAKYEALSTVKGHAGASRIGSSVAYCKFQDSIRYQNKNVLYESSKRLTEATRDTVKTDSLVMGAEQMEATCRLEM
ncbi:hypothetical protein Ccrd_009361, partial [Cynara cardunculus var. scolymus]